MTESKKLSRRQLALLDDLFAGKLKEPRKFSKSTT